MVLGRIISIPSPTAKCKDMSVRSLIGVAVVVIATQPDLLWGELQPHSLRAFEDYIRKTETRIYGQIREQHFLWVDGSEDRLARVRLGEVITEPFDGIPEIKIPDGLIHDWIGSIFIPGATLKDT